MSPESREQMSVLYEDIWDEFTSTVSEARKVSRNQIDLWSQNIEVSDVAEAFNKKLIDQLGPEYNVTEEIKTRLNIKESDSSPYISLSQYVIDDSSPFVSFAQQISSKQESDENKIALIAMAGDIISGFSRRRKYRI